MAEHDDEQGDPDASELSPWEARRMRLQKQAVRDALIEFGLNPQEPLEIQQDMAWVRRRRKLEESMTAKVVGAVLTLLVTPGVVAAIVSAFLQQQR